VIWYVKNTNLRVLGGIMKTLMLSIAILMSISAMANNKSTKVIYGTDGRLDIYQVRNPLHKRLALSTAAMISTSKLKKSRGIFSISHTKTLEDGANICPSELFSQQPMLAGCSGFLVGKDILVSAGHCFKGTSSGSCNKNSWLFGLEMQSHNKINLKNIPAKNVYKCKKVIMAKLTGSEDFAVIQLDREVVGRAPLKFRKQGKISSKAKLVVIGHPTMIPTKVADGGTIIANRDKFQFTTTLDTFHGNSGSAVFDSKTGVLEGILVSGKTDYVNSIPGNARSCMVVNVCDMKGKNCIDDEGARGENVTRITTLTRYIK